MKYDKCASTDRIGVQTVGLLFGKHGYIFREQSTVDCGIDAQIELVSGNNASGKLIAVQIKSGSSWFKEKNDIGYVYRGKREHLEYWLNHSQPVIIVLCDIESNLVYWQAISKHIVEYTPKGWKVTVPYQQQINAGMHTDLCNLVEQIEIIPDYTITKTSDVSHGAAKRYSARITLSKAHSQSELLSIIKSLTAEIKLCEYHRNDATRLTWRNQPAHVVSLFIYPSAKDERNNNFLCSTEWISDELDIAFRPNSQGGQDIGMGIKVQWNTMYLQTAKYNEENELSKESFIQFVESSILRSESIFNEFTPVLSQYIESNISYNDLCHFILIHQGEVKNIYEEGTYLGLSSYECKEASIKYRSMIAHLDNIFMLFNQENEKSTVYNIRDQVSYFVKAFNGLRYELDKIK